MDIQIDNVAGLKDFILNVATGLDSKIEVTTLCLNITILGSVNTTAELIDIIEENSNNKYRNIILGKGTKPHEDNL